jgi:hypothetical protein
MTTYIESCLHAKSGSADDIITENHEMEEANYSEKLADHTNLTAAESLFIAKHCKWIQTIKYIFHLLFSTNRFPDDECKKHSK